MEHRPDYYRRIPLGLLTDFDLNANLTQVICRVDHPIYNTFVITTSSVEVEVSLHIDVTEKGSNKEPWLLCHGKGK